MPSAGVDKPSRDVVATCRELNVKIQTLPGMYEIVDGKVSLKAAPGYSDRGPAGAGGLCVMDMQEIGAYLWAGHKVLITGAGGFYWVGR